MLGKSVVGLVVAGSTVFLLAGFGCGSTKKSSFEDPTSDEGGTFAKPDACTGLFCKQVTCAPGKETTVTGTVYAPNGELPLYNAIVYVPNAEPAPFLRGVACDQCGAVTGEPVVSALSGADGKFELKHVPVGKDIPLVIQVGKWRRKVTIPEVKECEELELDDSDMTRLPRNQDEGSMPQIALTTGGCDKLGCMLPKVGIDASEFGAEKDGNKKAVHVFAGGNAQDQAPSWESADVLWSDVDRLRKYDMVILSCECEEHLENKGAGSFGAMAEYLKAGGRIFTTDFMYTWYRNSPDQGLSSATSMRGGAPVGGSPLELDTSFPKGQALVDWLHFIGATPTKGKLTPDVVFGNIISLDPDKAQHWASSGPLQVPEGPRLFTVNVPVGVPAAQQCGKGVHIDAHLNQSGGFGEEGDDVKAGYPATCSKELKPGENLLAFFFFDLASCIQDEKVTPQPPR